MVSKADARTAAREKAAALREQAVRRKRRNRGLVVASVVVAVGLVASGVTFAVQSSTAASSTARSKEAAAARIADATALRSASEGRTTAPPWARPSDTAAAVTAAGLALLTTEGEALHIHQHLSITVDGEAVVVPAGLGIVSETQLSSLHTHETDGILHVESPVVKTFRLDQAFAEWDVRLAQGALGPYVDGRDGVELAVFVDQKRYTGDPREIVLRGHEDIDFVVTTNGATPKAPAAFDWPSGY